MAEAIYDVPKLSKDRIVDHDGIRRKKASEARVEPTGDQERRRGGVEPKIA
jgi:hypothetical protein